MLKCLISATALFLALFPSYAGQTDRTLVFNSEKRIPVTSVKKQGRSSTCWCYSGVSFVEAEIIRKNRIKDESRYPSISEAFIISKSLHDRAEKYIRLDGNLRAAPGSEGADVVEVIRKYGIIPREIYPCPDFSLETNLFRELTSSVRSYLKGLVERRDKELSKEWINAFDGLVEGYLGPCPKDYDAVSCRDSWGFDASEYINITSMSNVPYHEMCIVEVMDNWRWTPSLNLPLDEMIEVIDRAVDKGYTVHIAADITQKGYPGNGIATLVSEDADYDVALPEEEIKTTPEERQDRYDRKITTDDHAMHLVGKARDQYGRKFYVVKDSHGEYGPFKGYVYMSEEYLRMNVLTIMVHKSILD